MKQQFVIHMDWLPRGLSPNGRMHFYAKSAVFKRVRTCAFILTKAALEKHRIENVQLADGSRINLTFIVTPPDRRRRDEDNFLASCKAVIDGIAAGIEIDDCRFHFREQIWNTPGKPGHIAVLVDWEEEECLKSED